MITSTIEAHEERDVASIDIPGAYLHAHVGENGKIIMLFKGSLAELMAMIEPKQYCKYIAYDIKGNTVLYVQVSKILCGLLESALHFYKKLVKDLEEYRFERLYAITYSGITSLFAVD